TTKSMSCNTCSSLKSQRVSPRARAWRSPVKRQKRSNDGHIAGIDELLPQISGVLDDAVALVEVNDGRPFAAAGGLAEKSVDAIVDLNRREHGRLPPSSHN